MQDRAANPAPADAGARVGALAADMVSRPALGSQAGAIADLIDGAVPLSD